ncbi:GNAT family N-acetyltransferase [Halarcobacter sp.]|uniref:GNAT family N-acetyltransferase n=1 Tax=Halarcobacter sp. TaxID=2321133 RepID=UPI0029F4961A|nr:GNAT family N-acetyltransferase [Halarcobacter sp.]
MNIIKADIKDAEKISFIIKKANEQVAKEFNLNIDNCPKHPSFCTKDWVISDFERDEEYFLYKKDENIVACVAFENPKPEVAYLNRLSVLPLHQKQKIGEELVSFIFKYAKTKNIKRVSIGIIAKHEKLKNWYLKLGFEEGRKSSFEHLPFEVLYMNKYL